MTTTPGQRVVERFQDWGEPERGLILSEREASLLARLINEECGRLLDKIHCGVDHSFGRNGGVCCIDEARAILRALGER